MPIQKKTSTFSPYFTEDEAAQVRAAWKNAGNEEGYASLSDLIVAATMREVRRLQRKYNDGRKWEPVSAGEFRPGQRTKDELAHRAAVTDQKVIRASASR